MVPKDLLPLVKDHYTKSEKFVADIAQLEHELQMVRDRVQASAEILKEEWYANQRKVSEALYAHGIINSVDELYDLNVMFIDHGHAYVVKNDDAVKGAPKNAVLN